MCLSVSVCVRLYLCVCVCVCLCVHACVHVRNLGEHVITCTNCGHTPTYSNHHITVMCHASLALTPPTRRKQLWLKHTACLIALNNLW